MTNRMRMPRKYSAIRLTITIALILPMVGGCFVVKFTRSTLGYLFLPPETERQLGAQIAAEINAQEPILYNRSIQRYITSIGNRVAQASMGDRSDIQYRFTVIDRPDQINAFAVPGGYIYLYSGLLIAAGDEAEIAGVLAHEVGHIVGRHSANQIGTQYGIATLVSVALGDNPEIIKDIAARFIAYGATLKFSRDDERESDAYAVKYAIGSGYDPHQMLNFFRTLQELYGGGTSAVEVFFSTHPPSQERIDSITDMINRAGNPRGEVGRRRYQAQIAALGRR